METFIRITKWTARIGIAVGVLLTAFLAVLAGFGIVSVWAVVGSAFGCIIMGLGLTSIEAATGADEPVTIKRHLKTVD